MSRKEIYISIYLSVIYIVGIVGIAMPLHPQFVYLTPLNFVVSLILVAISEKNWNGKLIGVLVALYGIGWLAEAIGVNDGRLFGDFYTYGDAMGLRFYNTPLTAGLLWVIVVTGTAALSNFTFKTEEIFTKSLFGAFLLVSLDVLIEPVAIKLNFWRWAHHEIPLQNYVGWFCVGFIELLFIHFFIPKFQNKLAIVLLLLQFLFFIVFNFI